MLSKRVVAAARGRAVLRARSAAVSAHAYAGVLSAAWRTTGTYVLRSQFHSTHLLQDEIVKVPTMAESISEGTLKTWKVKVGDHVEADEEVASIETDKIDVSVNAPKAGKITEILVEEEATVAVGQDLFKLEPGAVGEAKPTEEPKPEEAPKPEPPKEEPKLEVEPKEAAAPAPEPSKPSPPPPPPPPPSRPAEPAEKPAPPPPAAAAARPPAGARNETRIKMSRMRLRIAERLKESQNTAASLTTFNEIDMSSLMAMRSRLKEPVLKEYDVKLGFMSAFAKASCLALKEIPAANASIDGDEIVYRDYVDLSVAVATPRGLVTPVVRNAESMGFVDIEKEIAALGKKARDGKLTIEDMAGGTFTISNGGVFGSLYGTPIINVPQAAVLGMHTIKERPVVINGEIVIRPMMVIALTYDHRLLDGREAVTFLVKVRDYIQDPVKMLL